MSEVRLVEVLSGHRKLGERPSSDGPNLPFPPKLSK
jgi:hypothetical protein